MTATPSPTPSVAPSTTPSLQDQLKEVKLTQFYEEAFNNFNQLVNALDDTMLLEALSPDNTDTTLSTVVSATLNDLFQSFNPPLDVSEQKIFEQSFLEFIKASVGSDLLNNYDNFKVLVNEKAAITLNIQQLDQRLLTERQKEAEKQQAVDNINNQLTNIDASADQRVTILEQARDAVQTRLTEAEAALTEKDTEINTLALNTAIQPLAKVTERRRLEREKTGIEGKIVNIRAELGQANQDITDFNATGRALYIAGETNRLDAEKTTAENELATAKGVADATETEINTLNGGTGRLAAIETQIASYNVDIPAIKTSISDRLNNALAVIGNDIPNAEAALRTADPVVQKLIYSFLRAYEKETKAELAQLLSGFKALEDVGIRERLEKKFVKLTDAIEMAVIQTTERGASTYFSFFALREALSYCKNLVLSIGSEGISTIAGGAALGTTYATSIYKTRAQTYTDLDAIEAVNTVDNQGNLTGYARRMQKEFARRKNRPERQGDEKKFWKADFWKYTGKQRYQDFFKSEISATDRLYNTWLGFKGLFKGWKAPEISMNSIRKNTNTKALVALMVGAAVWDTFSTAIGNLSSNARGKRADKIALITDISNQTLGAEGQTVKYLKYNEVSVPNIDLTTRKAQTAEGPVDLGTIAVTDDEKITKTTEKTPEFTAYNAPKAKTDSIKANLVKEATSYENFIKPKRELAALRIQLAALTDSLSADSSLAVQQLIADIEALENITDDSEFKAELQNQQKKVLAITAKAFKNMGAQSFVQSMDHLQKMPAQIKKFSEIVIKKELGAVDRVGDGPMTKTKEAILLGGGVAAVQGGYKSVPAVTNFVTKYPNGMQAAFEKEVLTPANAFKKKVEGMVTDFSNALATNEPNLILEAVTNLNTFLNNGGTSDLKAINTAYKNLQKEANAALKAVDSNVLDFPDFDINTALENVEFLKFAAQVLADNTIVLLFPSESLNQAESGGEKMAWLLKSMLLTLVLLFSSNVLRQNRTILERTMREYEIMGGPEGASAIMDEAWKNFVEKIYDFLNTNAEFNRISMQLVMPTDKMAIESEVLTLIQDFQKEEEGSMLGRGINYVKDWFTSLKDVKKTGVKMPTPVATTAITAGTGAMAATIQQIHLEGLAMNPTVQGKVGEQYKNLMEFVAMLESAAQSEEFANRVIHAFAPNSGTFEATTNTLLSTPGLAGMPTTNLVGSIANASAIRDIQLDAQQNPPVAAPATPPTTIPAPPASPTI